MRRQWVSAVVALAFASILAGCGGGSTANVRNQPPPVVNKVSIAFQPAPGNSIQLGTPIDLTAVVSNDSSNAGVDWNVVCQGANCGSFSSPHTPSGQANTYTPPSNFAGNTFSVTLEAFATADHTQNATAPLTISGFGGTFQGTYILQAQGVDSSFSQPYQFTGAVVLDGNGGITAGEATLNVVDPNIGFLVTKSVTVTGGSYFVGSDGRGTLTIDTSDPSIGTNGTGTFSLVYLSGSQAFITENDFTATASGTMDLQTSVVAPSGGYAFAVDGFDVANQIPTAFGGVFNVSAPNTISSTGSVSDQNLAGVVTQNSSLSGNISSPDPFGAVTIDLNIGFASGVPVQFTGYMVDATHMKLIESDNSGGTGFGSTGGLAIGQGAATGTFTANSLSGSYVFGISGEDLSVFVPATLTSAGVFTSDGAGHVTTGFTDTFLQGNCVQANCLNTGFPGAQVSSAFTGTYTVSASKNGRVQLARTFPASVQPAFHQGLLLYLTGNGAHPALILDLGDPTTQNYPSLGTGIAYPQTTGLLAFAGTYGFSLTQQNGAEVGSVAQFAADASTSSLSGVMDIPGSQNLPITGTFATPGSDGRFAATLTGQFETISPIATEFYAIDSGHGFFVETDLTDPNNPSFTVSLGYYAARAPLCAGCP